jgi:hypothetical protein
MKTRVVWLVTMLILTAAVVGQAAAQKLALPLGLQEQAAFVPGDNAPTP